MRYKNQEKAAACDDPVSCRRGGEAGAPSVKLENETEAVSVEQKMVRARTEMAPFARAGGRAGSFETLREREQRFHELLEALPAAIYTTDANGKITYFNQAAVDLWGGAPADVTVDYDTAGLCARIVVSLPH